MIAVLPIELDHAVDMTAATQAALAQRAWQHPFGRLIYTMPPYIASEDEMHCTTQTMLATARVE